MMRTIKVVIGMVNGSKIINKLIKHDSMYVIEQTTIDEHGRHVSTERDACGTYAKVKALYPQFDNNVRRNELEQAAMEIAEHLEG